MTCCEPFQHCTAGLPEPWPNCYFSVISRVAWLQHPLYGASLTIALVHTALATLCCVPIARPAHTPCRTLGVHISAMHAMLTPLPVCALFRFVPAALDLLASELTDTGIAAFGKLPHLHELKLYQAGVTAEGLSMLAGQPAGSGLHSLVLYGTGGLRELACLGGSPARAVTRHLAEAGSTAVGTQQPVVGMRSCLTPHFQHAGPLSGWVHPCGSLTLDYRPLHTL